MIEPRRENHARSEAATELFLHQSLNDLPGITDFKKKAKDKKTKTKRHKCKYKYKYRYAYK